MSCAIAREVGRSTWRSPCLRRRRREALASRSSSSGTTAWWPPALIGGLLVARVDEVTVEQVDPNHSVVDIRAGPWSRALHWKVARKADCPRDAVRRGVDEY